MSKKKEYRKLVLYRSEAEELLDKFDKIDVEASMRETPNGKWLVIFWI